jgi:nucleoside-diphosphate-sugar epimerase
MPEFKPMTDWRALHDKNYEGTRVLVTGAAGFIGSHLCSALATLGATVVAIDDLGGGAVVNIEAARQEAKAAGGRGQIEWLPCSVLDASTLAKAVAGCRYVFHQAALGSVPRSVKEPEKYVQNNIVGTFNILEASRAAKVERVLFAASSSAYGDTPTLPKVETMPVLPRSPYAASKVAGEALLRAYAHSYGLDTLSLRYFNIFGPRQNANSAYAAVIAAFAKAFLAGERPFITGDGEQSRDFTFVHNAVHANLLGGAMSGKPTKADGAVVNIACGHRVTVNKLAEMMAQQLGVPHLKPTHEPDRAGDVKHSLADITAAQYLIGYRPIVPFEPGLAATVEWYRKSM